MNTDSTQKPIISSLGVASMAEKIWGNSIPPEAYAFAKLLQAEVAHKQAEQLRYMEDSLRRVMETLSPTFERDGVFGAKRRAEFMEDVGQVCRDEFAGRLRAFEFGVAYGPQGYSDGAKVSDEASLIFNRHTIDALKTAGWTVVMMPAHCIDGLSFPRHEEMLSAAEDALARGKKYGFTIGSENAAEVMREELSVESFDGLPPQCDAIYSMAMVSAIDRAQNAPRERGGA